MKIRMYALVKKKCHVCHRVIVKEHYWLMDVPFPIQEGMITTYVCEECEQKGV